GRAETSEATARDRFGGRTIVADPGDTLRNSRSSGPEHSRLVTRRSLDRRRRHQRYGTGTVQGSGRRWRTGATRRKSGDQSHLVARRRVDRLCGPVLHRPGSPAWVSPGWHACDASIGARPAGWLSLPPKQHGHRLSAISSIAGFLVPRSQDRQHASAHASQQPGQAADLRHHTRWQADRLRSLARELGHRVDRTAEVEASALATRGPEIFGAYE